MWYLLRWSSYCISFLFLNLAHNLIIRIYKVRVSQMIASSLFSVFCVRTWFCFINVLRKQQNQILYPRGILLFHAHHGNVGFSSSSVRVLDVVLPTSSDFRRIIVMDGPPSCWSTNLLVLCTCHAWSFWGFHVLHGDNKS